MTFSVGAAIPILIVRFVPVRSMSFAIATTSLGCLALLGSVAARAGGARPVIGALRVAFWGALAMALTYGVGLLFGTVP
jgi:VIT1/CCC1 family predicted Fe2+/Mn2+ transporter